jgi:hypothetical protein
MEDLGMIKKELAVVEKEIQIMEKGFKKKTMADKKGRRYSYPYVKAVAKYSFLYGKVAVLEGGVKDMTPDYIG